MINPLSSIGFIVELLFRVLLLIEIEENEGLLSEGFLDIFIELIVLLLLSFSSKSFIEYGIIGASFVLIFSHSIPITH